MHISQSKVKESLSKTLERSSKEEIKYALDTKEQQL